MELSILALQAVKIAFDAMDKVSGGALEKAGANVLDFLIKRFQGKLQIKRSDSKILEAAILCEAGRDDQFQEDLERLVTQYHQTQNTFNISQSTDSGANFNFGSNAGTVIGQQKIETQQFFRR